MSTGQDNRYQSIQFDDRDFPFSAHANRVSSVDHADRNSQIFHEEIEIKYFYEGRATLVVDTTEVVVESGDIVVINPYEFHSTVELDEQQTKYHLFMVGLDCFTARNPSGLNLRRLMLAKGIRIQNLIRENEMLQKMLTNILAEYRKADEISRYAAEAHLQLFFVELLRHHVNPDSQPIALDEKIRNYLVIDPAIRQIHTGYSEKLTIDSLAEACNVSKYHFCRVFKRATGMSAIQYLMRYRLKIAHAFLNETDRSIAEIAWQCGFSDESYFCRCYKKQYGDSPWKNRATSCEK